MSWIHRLGRHVRFRVTHHSKFPKGDFIAFLYRLASRGFRPQHIIDVGANKGNWSRRIHAVFPECTFTMIEPQREMQPQLDALCRKVPGSRWICAGAGAVRGQLALTVNPDTVSSSFTPSETAAANQKFEHRLVPIVTLDDVVREEDGRIPDMVKIDAEGLEPDVLRGAQSLIGRTEVFLLQTYLFSPPPNWPTTVEVLKLMDELGYEIFDVVMLRRQFGELALAKIAFVRRGGVLRPATATGIERVPQRWP
jgi:FkbM family methyltransferase